MCSWYVVHTQPRAEETAARNLDRQGFEAFLPLYRRQIRHARRRLEVRRPLFPGYLFVRFDPATCRWRSINGTVGVRYLLGDRTRPIAVPEPVIEAILARADEGGEVTMLSKPLARGQSVQLVDGPFAECTALFEEIRDDMRVTILLSVLGRAVRVHAPAAALQPAA